MKKLMIEKDKLKNNIEKIKSLTDKKIIGVLKGNGYGLGIIPFANFLIENGVNDFAVADLEEALLLRENGFLNTILLLTPTMNKEDAKAIIQSDITATVGSYANAELVNETALELGMFAKVHLKIDSGFGRYGYFYKDIGASSTLLKSLSNISITGTYSHLSYSFEKKPRSVYLQFQNFMDSIESLRQNGIDPGLTHISNSCAFLRFPSMHLDAVRIGSAFVGRIPIENVYNLQKIAVLKSQIVEIKILPKGSYAGYANTFKARRDIKTGIVPVGYKDGFGIEKTKDTFRPLDILRYVYHDILSLNKRLYITLENGQKARILGRIGMYSLIIDLTATEAKAGDAVYLDVNPILVNATISREYV